MRLTFSTIVDHQFFFFFVHGWAFLEFPTFFCCLYVRACVSVGQNSYNGNLPRNTKICSTHKTRWEICVLYCVETKPHEWSLSPKKFYNIRPMVFVIYACYHLTWFNNCFFFYILSCIDFYEATILYLYHFYSKYEVIGGTNFQTKIFLDDFSYELFQIKESKYTAVIINASALASASEKNS